MTTEPLYPLLPTWADNAECLTADPEIFFPRKGESVEPAKAICARCPVAAECLEHALTHFTQWSDFGVWGGTSEGERRRLRQRIAS